MHTRGAGIASTIGGKHYTRLGHGPPYGANAYTRGPGIDSRGAGIDSRPWGTPPPAPG